MNQNFTRILRCFLFVIAGFCCQPAIAQTSTDFAVETSASDLTAFQTLVLPGNKVGVFSWDATGTYIYLSIYDASGTRTLNVNITSQINWPHSTHGAVTFKAATTTDGKIFLAYAINSNSAGMQTYNARYTLLDANGVGLVSGQINTTNATDYIFNLVLDRLSDGKIVAVWKMGNATACFRLFNANGTPFAANMAFAGVGTSVPVNYIYTVMLAAGKSGNFMVSLYNSSGSLRGFLFDNSGNNAIAGGAASMIIDPSLVNDYANIGLVSLSNGNFVQSWYLQRTNYMAILAKDGSAVKPKFASGLTDATDFFAVYTKGSEGYIQTELVYQNMNDMGNPYQTYKLNRFDNNGQLQSSTLMPEGYLIQPAYSFVPGVGGGYAYLYSYYKSYTVDEMMGMYMVQGDRDTRGATVGLSMIPLAVDIVRFTAELVGRQQVQLNWATASETANRYFEVQKSGDGINFRTIGQVLAKASEGSGASYQFNDPELLTANAFYKLRQVAVDGSKKDMGTRQVKFSGSSIRTSVYPNPVVGKNITVTVGAVMLPQSWQLVDGSGKTVGSGVLEQNSQQLYLGNILPGVYYLHIGGDTVIKLVK